MTSGFIGVDWGTTQVRAFLVNADDNIDRQVSRDQGASRLNQNQFEPVLRELLGELAAASNTPIILCGMVGSSIGWKEASYVNCPAGAQEIKSKLLKFEIQDHAVMIVPGLATRTPLDLPDVMRGEETQLLGLMQAANLSTLACLPGTHTKWATINNRQIETFQTAITGEMYDLLSKQSILTQGPQHFNSVAFDDGVNTILRHPGYFTHQLFSTRSKTLRSELAATDGASYLSGLLIGSDVQQALQANAGDIALVADQYLGNLYHRAMTLCGAKATHHESQSLTIAGMRALLEA